MGHPAYAEASPEFDENGFLVDPQTWDEQLAEWLARVDGIGPLSEQHWRIIWHLREHYERFGSFPVARLVCRANHLERHSIQTLFSGCREAWRISGLPDPGEEAKAYM